MSLMIKIKRFFSAQDMTEGNISQNIIRFSIPLLLGNFAQLLYSTVDSIIVGQNVEGGLAAIGTTFPLINFLLLLFIAIATGAGVMVSQYFGAKDYKNLNKAIGNSILLIILSSIFLMAITIPFAERFLLLINTPQEIVGMAASYLRILFIGLIPLALFNIISGILRGLGDSFNPLLYLLFATVINIILDLYFVTFLGWGVAGAAWATIIAQGFSAIFCIIRLLRIKNIPRFKRSDFAYDSSIVKELLRLGIPSGLMQGIFSIAMLTVQNLTNQMGTMVIEANTAVIRIDSFIMMPNQTFGMAATTFVGQNVGARKMQRVEEGTKIMKRMAFATATVLTILVVLFGKQMLHMFTASEEIISLGYMMILILLPGYIAVSQTQVLGGIMRGAGDTMASMWISICTSILTRIPLAYLFSYFSRSEEWPHGHPYSLNISLVIAWILGAIISNIWFNRGRWREKSIIRDEEPGPFIDEEHAPECLKHHEE